MRAEERSRRFSLSISDRLRSAATSEPPSAICPRRFIPFCSARFAGDAELWQNSCGAGPQRCGPRCAVQFFSRIAIRCKVQERRRSPKKEGQWCRWLRVHVYAASQCFAPESASRPDQAPPGQRRSPRGAGPKRRGAGRGRAPLGAMAMGQAGHVGHVGQVDEAPGPGSASHRVLLSLVSDRPLEARRWGGGGLLCCCAVVML